MNSSPTIKELAGALTKAQGQIVGAVKDAANPFFRSAYADMQSVWDAIRKPLTDNGLSIVQAPLTDGDKVGVETMLLHESGEFLVSTLWMTPVKNDPQAIGSAITYARRYALQAVAGVASIEEDDDGEGASGRGGKKPKHTPYREEEKATKPAKESPTGAADLATLRGWMTENAIPEDFLMKLAKEGKLSVNETKLEELKPGSLSRLLAYRPRVLSRYKEAGGTPEESKPTSRETEGEESPKVGPRTPAQTSIAPREYLKQEGVEDWREVQIHFGTKQGHTLGALHNDGKLSWWITDWHPKPFGKAKKIGDADLLLDAALCCAALELA